MNRRKAVPLRLAVPAAILLIWVAVFATVVAEAQVITPTVAGAYDLNGSTAPSAQSNAAGHVEPLPSYCHARLLRDDATLRAIAFRDAIHGLACGDRGVVLRTSDGGESWSPVESGTDVCLDDIDWIGPNHAVAVGGRYDMVTGLSRGVIVRSSDGGQSWSVVDDQELPRLHSLQVKDHVLRAKGDWSSSLLTDVVESRDGGRKWQGGTLQSERSAPAPKESTHPAKATELIKWARAIDAPVAIRDACRVGADGICAVGDHGVILFSENRGRTWHWQRGKRRRTAVMIVSAQPASTCWCMIGNETLQNGHRTTVIVADVRSSTAQQQLSMNSSRYESVDPQRLARQAVVMLGGSGVDEIDVSSKADEPPERGIELEAERWVQIHAPTVVLLDHSLPRSVRDAFFQAATSSGTSRVAVYGGDRGRIVLHRNALLARVGALASDLESDAMMLVAPYRLTTPSVKLRYLYDVAASRRQGDSVCEGITLISGQRLAADLPAAGRRRLQMTQARMQQSQRIDDLLRSTHHHSPFEGALSRLLNQTAQDDRLRLAWTLYTESKSRDRQRVILSEIADRFAHRSAGRFALLRSDMLRGSWEWERLQSIGGEQSHQAASVTAAVAPPVSPFQSQVDEIQQVAALSSPVVVPDRSTGQRESKQESEASVDLAWEFHPLVLIAEDAQRHRGESGELQPADGSSANLQRLTQSPHDPWARLLASQTQRIEAKRCEYPPRLDGVLNDSCWQTAIHQAGRSSRLMFSYDDDYVYAAMQWSTDSIRPDLVTRSKDVRRDHNLSDADRLRLRIDLDRDLLTSMQLHVSSSGRTRDQIDQDDAWQPTWYVATKRDDRWATVELAIWRRDLIDLPIVTGQIWYVSLDRLPAGMQADQPVIPDPAKWMRVEFR